MLVRFSVENFRSFSEVGHISMTANGRISRMEDHTIVVDDIRLLKGAFVYGANASGKSNLIKAVDFARRIILNGSAQNVDLGKYSKILKDGIKQPGVFQFEILVENKVYSYGFALSYQDGTIIEEWLYELRPSGSEVCLFARGKQGAFETGLNLTGKTKTRFDIYSEDIKSVPRELFLTELAEKPLENELAIFSKIYEWFEDLIVIFPDSEFNLLPFVMKSERMRERFIKLLGYFDTGITDIDAEDTTLKEALRKLPHDVAGEFVKDMRQRLADHNELVVRGPGFLLDLRRLDNGELRAKKMLLKHGNAQEGFDLYEESDGTQRLFDLAPLLFGVLKNNVIFIDEIDRNMHPKLTVELVEMFYRHNVDSDLQLIATTHESALLDLQLLRQDEIWFIEKQSGSSQMTSLDDFKVRYDKVIERDYLLGRYGAIPLFDSLTMMAEEVADYD